VQVIGQVVLELAGLLLPPPRVVEPARVMGDVRPGPDERHAGEQRIDVPLKVGKALQVARDPVSLQPAPGTRQLQKHGPQELEVVVELELPVVGDLAHLPEELDAAACPTAGDHLGISSQPGEGTAVVRAVDRDEAGVRRPPGQRCLERFQRAQVEIGVAPEDLRLHRKAVLFDGAHRDRRQGWQGRQRHEPARVVVAPGAPRDLLCLLR